jgi:hypothetical protein
MTVATSFVDPVRVAHATRMRSDVVSSICMWCCRRHFSRRERSLDNELYIRFRLGRGGPSERSAGARGRGQQSDPPGVFDLTLATALVTIVLTPSLMRAGPVILITL